MHDVGNHFAKMLLIIIITFELNDFNTMIIWLSVPMLLCFNSISEIYSKDFNFPETYFF